jgi:hypothetical protein
MTEMPVDRSALQKNSMDWVGYLAACLAALLVRDLIYIRLRIRITIHYDEKSGLSRQSRGR